MAHFNNSFALLDDEDGDDLAVLVDHIVKKVDVSSMHAQNETQSSKFVREENGPRKGGLGRRNGNRGNGYDGNYDTQGGYDWDDHWKNNGNEDTFEDNGHWGGDSTSLGGGVGAEDGWLIVNEASGGDTYQTDDYEPGWQDVSKSNGKECAIYGGPSKDGHNRISNGNQSYSGERRGYADEVHCTDAAVGRRSSFGNGNWSYNDGERAGHRNRVHNEDAAGGQKRFQDDGWGGSGYQVRDYDAGSEQPDVNWESSEGNKFTDKERTYRNGNRSNGRERRGYGGYKGKGRHADGQKRFQDDGWGGSGYQVQDYDAGSEQHDVNWESSYGNKFTDKERTYGNGNRSNGRERRGYGGYRGKGRHEYHRTGSEEVKETKDAVDGHDVKAEYVNGSKGDGAVVLEVLKAAETEEKNISEEINGGFRDPKEDANLQKKEEELEKKKEDKEATLMTLDEYEKLLVDKRQALESLKTEERRVALDKELEGMRLIEKKQDDTDDKQKSEEKLKKKGSLEKKEKGRKLVVLEARELFKPASRQRSFDGRRGGRGGRGRGEHVSFSDRTKYYRGPLTYGAAIQRQRAPTDDDFPVLGSNPPAPAADPVKAESG